MKNVNFLQFMFTLFRIITSQKKHCHKTQNTATLSENNARKFSAEVSEVHAAARGAGPGAADIDSKACNAAFHQLTMD